MFGKTTSYMLREALTKFVGRTCIGFVTGASTGSVISLEFEPRRPRRLQVSNSALTDDQRTGEAEYSLFIECTWRLDSEESVVCGAWDESSVDGLKMRGLQALVGKKVLLWTLAEPAFDLQVKFENGWTFRIFCDQVNELANYDNYCAFLPSEVIVVGARGEIRREDITPG